MFNQEAKRIYKVGDEFILTEEIISKMRSWDQEQWRLRLKDGKIKGKCYPRRLDRIFGRMCIWWEDGLETNVYAFEPMAYFEPVTFDELSVLECPVDLLSARECVLRGLMETGDSLESAERIVYSVLRGMDKYGVVFYIP